MQSDRAVGVAVLLFSLIALGTWPALLDLSALHGRHPAHAYLDYCSAVLLVAGVLALASGEPLTDAGWVSITLAGGGGVLLMLGNLSMQRALLMGVPLTIVLPLQGSLTVVIGTSINFVLQPERSEPHLLGAGVVAFLVAILLSTRAQRMHERSTGSSNRLSRPPTMCCRPAVWCVYCGEAPLMAHDTTSDATPDPAATTSTTATSESLPAQPPRPPGAIGLGVAAVGGLCFGFFSPAFNVAVNDELGWIQRTGGKPLGLFAANLYFCLCFTASGWAANLALMACPPPGAASSSLQDYLRSGRNGRLFAVLAGGVCALGNGAQFFGDSLAGFAAADLVQAYPLVGTVWGIGCFGEFRGASRRVYCLLGGMYAAFIAAICLLAISVQ